MSQPSESRFANPSGRSVIWGWSLTIGFGAVATALFLSPRLAPIPLQPAVIVDCTALVPGPRRVAMTDPPHLIVEGMPQNCNGCHQIFRSAHLAGATLNYHQNFQLEHGLNDRCLNCHDSENSELLTLRDGTTVPFSETPRLCAQCHGTVYRDWQRGTHGQTMGSWITGSKEQVRLNCNQCHDPHAPRYPSYEPLAAPNTLRMGDQKLHGCAEPSRSPLQRWLTPAESFGDTKPTPQGHHP